MIYLRAFYLPSADREFASAGPECPGYPYTLFSLKDLTEVHFSPITMICGGNGSGKSTLLNMIAAKLGLSHESAHFQSQVFQTFVGTLTSAGFAEDDDGVLRTLPKGSRLITGDDIVSVMLNDRERNTYLVKARERAEAEQRSYRRGASSPFRSLEDYDALCEHLIRRKESPGQFASRTVGDFVPTRSNGETAIEALQRAIQPGRLYLLDEPENSLSPRFQAALASVIMESAKYFDCQFIIATHSPFLMAMPGATLYDLDARPVCTKPWYDFPAMRDWYALFKMHEKDFER